MENTGMNGLYRIKKLFREDRITGDLGVATVRLSREKGATREITGKIGSPRSQEDGHHTQVIGEGKLIIEVDDGVTVHIEPVL
jgi:hypothetical protein